VYRTGGHLEALKTTCRSLELVGEALTSIDDFDQSSGRHREEIFLKNLKTVRVYLTRLTKAQNLVVRSLSIIDEEPDTNLVDWLTPQELQSTLSAASTLLRILTVFSFYEQAIEDGKLALPVESKYADFCAVMRDMLCETWRLFYLVYRRISGISTLKLPDQTSETAPFETVNRCCELLSLIHEDLGERKWCHYGECTSPRNSLTQAKFLLLMMNEFLKYNTGEWDQEIIQCMYCLYGLSVSVLLPQSHLTQNESGYPYPHRAGRDMPDGKMALQIAQFLVRLYTNKRPGFTQLKSDYKVALDAVCKCLDHPSASSKQGWFVSLVVNCRPGV
jgi:hypothetical protein